MRSDEKEFQEHLNIGRENQEFISLGKAWCTNIRVDRGMWGVGLVEQATGLPITEGSFACDFAKNPSGVSGMRLVQSALVFYEDNCRGCEHRSPGNLIPNLGTWAEQLITKREQREEAQAEEQRIVAQEQQQRIEHRRVVGAALDAASQEVVGLINKLDIDRSNKKAEELLRATAQLTPDAFPDEIKDLLYEDALLLKMPLFVEVLSELDYQTNPPRLRSLCVTAVRDKWAIAEGCRYLSRYGTVDNVTEDLLEVVIFHAVPPKFPWERVPGKPAALFHFHSLAPESVETKIAALLRHGESNNRAVGTLAVQALLSVDPSAGDRLLGALLDCLCFSEEDMRDYDYTARKTSMTISTVFKANPVATEVAIQARWTRASLSFRARLLDIYSQLVHSQEGYLSEELAQSVFTRVIPTLEEPLAPRGDGLRDDSQRIASELLKRTVRKSPSTLLSLERLLGLLLFWVTRGDDLSGLEPEGEDFMGVLEHDNNRLRISIFCRNISEAIVAAALRDPDTFLIVCDDIYRGTEAKQWIQAEIVRMVGRVASQSLEHVKSALPLIYTAMLGDDQVTRVAGMEAAGEVISKLPPESVPPLLATAVARGLTDEYFVVGSAAVRAIQLLPAHLISSIEVVVQLVNIAFSYAADRSRDQLVRSALITALRLAEDDQRLVTLVRKKALLVINSMPAANAREVLLSISSLKQESGWVDAAIKALRTDDDLRFEDADDNARDDLLVQLTQRELSESQAESLMASDFVVRSTSPRRSLIAADLFAELDRFDLAAQIIRSALREMPDTIEQRLLQRRLSLYLCVFELEEAIATGDGERRSHLVEKARELCGKDD
ncbi:MAG: hypothetical protein OXI96_05040 [Acidimicrobiaceae bacterium]|nr:hypothetical protein [Acidimicrobiaceae bacterium]